MTKHVVQQVTEKKVVQTNRKTISEDKCDRDYAVIEEQVSNRPRRLTAVRNVMALFSLCDLASASTVLPAGPQTDTCRLSIETDAWDAQV